MVFATIIDIMHKLNQINVKKIIELINVKNNDKILYEDLWSLIINYLKDVLYISQVKQFSENAISGKIQVKFCNDNDIIRDVLFKYDKFYEELPLVTEIGFSITIPDISYYFWLEGPGFTGQEGPTKEESYTLLEYLYNKIPESLVCVSILY